MGGSGGFFGSAIMTHKQTHTPSTGHHSYLERLYRRELALFLVICGLLASFVTYGATRALDSPPVAIKKL